MNQRTTSQQNLIHGWFAFGLVVILLFSLFSSVPAFPVRAEQAVAVETETTGECSNLDVIFLVDQSRSMGGLPLPDNPLGNDPTLQRKYAVEGMIDMLVDLTLGQCPESYHRIGIISFGDEAEVDLPMSNIAPADSAEAIRLRDQLKASVRAVNLGKTNTWDAFLKAKQMFDNAGPTPAGTELRKRVIIQITDGFPCLEQLYCPDYQSNTISLRTKVAQQFPFSADLLVQENCMADLQQRYVDDENGIPPEEINTCLSEHVVAPGSYKNSTYIWTVLLKSETAYPNGVLENLENISDAHAGSMIQLSRNRSDIPAAIREILSQLAGVRPNVLDCGKSFAVNPYLRRMVVNAYGIDNSTQITMKYKDASGTPHSVTGGVDSSGAIMVSEYYTYGSNERYVIDYPYPGLWELTSSQNCNGLDVYYDPVQIDPTLYTPNLPDQVPQYDRSPYSDPNQPFYLEYQLLQRGERNPIPQADAAIFAINVQLTVTDPIGKTITYPMSYIPSETLFRSTKPLEVPAAGEYIIRIEGTSLMHEGEPVVDTTNLSDAYTTRFKIFENADVKYKVFPVQPFLINVVSPEAGSMSRSVHASILQGWPLNLESFPVRVRITDRQDNILTNLDDIFVDPSQAFQATLSGGSNSSTPVALQPDPNIPGEFISELPGVDLVGSQTLTISSIDTAIQEQYVPDDPKVEVNFTRADYLWTAPVFYIFLFWFLVALCAGIIGYTIWNHNNKVSGTLRFEDGGVPIAEFGLHNGTRTKKIGPRVLRNYPQFFLRKVVTQNAGNKRKTKAPVSDGVTDSLYMDNPEALGIRVTLTTTGGRKFTMDLPPKISTSYGEEATAQMVYEPPE